jgi:5'-3' exonuclease
MRTDVLTEQLAMVRSDLEHSREVAAMYKEKIYDMQESYEVKMRVVTEKNAELTRQVTRLTTENDYLVEQNEKLAEEKDEITKDKEYFQRRFYATIGAPVQSVPATTTMASEENEEDVEDEDEDEEEEEEEEDRVPDLPVRKHARTSALPRDAEDV